MPNKQVAIAFLHDLVAIVAAWLVAYLLRFNFNIPSGFVSTMSWLLLLVLPLQAISFIGFGLYQGVWRFASLPDLKRILKAVIIPALIIPMVLVMAQTGVVVPRSVLVLDPILLVLMMGGSRFSYRAWKEHRLCGVAQMLGEPVFVLGAGEAAMSLLKELERSSEWRVIGLLDDNVGMQGRQVYGISVLGKLDALSDLAKKLNVERVIVAMPSASHRQRRRAIDLANLAKLKVLTVPAFDDLMSGKVAISQIRQVEVEDLLGREPVILDSAGLHHLIENCVVMISGAGGSIGSELSRQIVKYKPSRLVCLDISEYALYTLEQELSLIYPSDKISYVVGDVKNAVRVQNLLQLYSPSVVFHAAAYKHVPMMEHENVAEALQNNVLGTFTLAHACKSTGVSEFVLISTDKAVNPTNVMGASKRLAELVCQGLQENQGTRFLMVRFGNVLGSSGSVIPKFREQIAKGGPITVTHPEITRYFMSIPEATQLVLQAALMGRDGQIFVLDMGEPVKIVELAKDMVRLSGVNPNEIEIVFTGLRPGEKLYEELLADDEQTLPTPHPKLRIAKARSTDQLWVEKLISWIDSLSGMNETQIKQELKYWVEEYVGYVGDNDGKASLPTLKTMWDIPNSSTIH